ncbi:hypothetical protein BJ878DRAFT_323710 [Calycina marina]|uniref:histone deacetylase n=1 Tax=Calycina marina TaxID=1763456 RepID=A0A9P7YUK2_9HELO|nr:hypothetical protein BJ878DRAFT_323710 [Calycina marina]
MGTATMDIDDHGGINFPVIRDEVNTNSYQQTETVNPHDIHYHARREVNTPESMEVDEGKSDSSRSALASVGITRRFKGTGVCFDNRMTLHANADFTASPHHPEDPRRITSIITALVDAGLIYAGSNSDVWLQQELERCPNKYMKRIRAREATEAEICLCHSAQVYLWAKQLANLTSKALRDMTDMMDAGRKSLYVGNLTFVAALLSAGGAIETCKNVVEDRVKNAFAVIRPPGHHAERDDSMGFCIFNNVPIAAKVCMADYPEKCRKVLIVDWDVHHGNGIQNIFYEDPNVLYISLHVYQEGEFYPGPPDVEGAEDGNITSIGAGLGKGMNVNIGWHDQGMGDGEYMAAFQRIVLPIAAEFDPDLVIVSAGFDAAAGDELGGCYVTPACYSQMTALLMTLANGRVAVCLEGGYDLKAISASALAVAQTLMGEPPQSLPLPPINNVADYILRQVRRLQSPYWNCMRGEPKAIQMTADEIASSRVPRITVAEAVQVTRRRLLLEMHKMYPLYIQRDIISSTFENQVLVTPNFTQTKNVVVFIHDAIEVRPGFGLDTQFFPGLSDFRDPQSFYMKDFKDIDFAVVDVNIPEHLPNLPIILPHPIGLGVESPSTGRDTQTIELLCYLWDNFLNFNSTESIVVVGAGSGFHAFHKLLLQRDCTEKVELIFGFLDDRAQMPKILKSPSDDNLSRWYKKRVNLWVDGGNQIWADDSDMQRKIAKNKYGNVVKGGIRTMELVRDTVMKNVMDHFGIKKEPREEKKLSREKDTSENHFGTVIFSD